MESPNQHGQLRSELVSDAWRHAKHVEAMWARMDEAERAWHLARLRLYRYFLDNMGDGK